MKQQVLPFHIGKAPRAIRKARLDNIALVPASLLIADTGKYQTITKNLPRGGVLICDAPAKPRLKAILAKVASYLSEQGHFVKTLPYSMLV
jgi:hypothetical protein